jgi:hypothetical protein
VSFFVGSALGLFHPFSSHDVEVAPFQQQKIGRSFYTAP